MFISDIMPSAPKKSLQEECMIIIIKQDLARNLLPDIVEEEVDLYEREISGFSSFPVVSKNLSLVNVLKHVLTF